MFKNDVLQIMFAYAVENGLCSNKKSFARLIGISESNYTKVFADTNEKFCTTNVLLKANAALGNVFSAQWLLTGEGEMYANINIERTHTHAQEIQGTNNDDKVAELESRVAELQSKVEMLEYIIETQKRLIKEIDQKRDKSASANVHSA